MKKIDHIEIKADPDEEDMLPEYDLDFSKARPNPYLGRLPLRVTLDADVAKVFKDDESVNKALRALISAMPETTLSAEVAGAGHE